VKNLFPLVIFARKTKDELKDQIEAFKAEVKYWDGYLEGRHFFANTFSIADIVVLPNFVTANLLGFPIKNYKNIHSVSIVLHSSFKSVAKYIGLEIQWITMSQRKPVVVHWVSKAISTNKTIACHCTT
jgi:hypothetical protein